MEKIKKVLEGKNENIVEIGDHYYIIGKKTRICVIPYTISSEGLLDGIGIVEDWNYIEEKKVMTILNGYISSDDETDLLAANRIFFETSRINVKDAKNWMYLGELYNNLNSDSPVKVYCVDISNIEIKEEMEKEQIEKSFQIMDSSRVIQTDEMLFLASYLRLFNYFYTKSLNKEKKE